MSRRLLNAFTNPEDVEQGECHPEGAVAVVRARAADTAVALVVTESGFFWPRRTRSAGPRRSRPASGDASVAAGVPSYTNYVLSWDFRGR